MSKQYWTPISVQLQVLESIFNQGNKTPNKSRIMQIVSELLLYGQIFDMNVYNWFKSSRARLRRLDISTQAHDSELVIQSRVQKDKLRKKHIDSIDHVELQKDLQVDENIGVENEVSNFDSCCIVLRSDPGLDQRVYNMPSCEQVAAVWVDDDPSASIKTRDILIYGHSNTAHRVNYYYGCYDPLQYPLIFTYGELG
ncbi:WUSCHEL-related homeobox 8-like [Olea europaea var. sylvestris]|uniref:WUSCHEL-related homeobox 8-like n=1 Tax=Olea europaea var. sylvestris TaxID=158386 RepID=UPI000C1CE071|nr:WUSCHEL-related homeobox 8-like [Olea europaea var. sylvestris]